MTEAGNKTDAIEALRLAKLQRRRERKMRRKRRLIEAQLVEAARRDDAPLVLAARAKRRAEHKEQRRQERRQARWLAEQAASRPRAEKAVGRRKSKHAVAVQIAESTEVPDEATGFVPTIRLRATQKDPVSRKVMPAKLTAQLINNAAVGSQSDREAKREGKKTRTWNDINKYGPGGRGDMEGLKRGDYGDVARVYGRVRIRMESMPLYVCNGRGYE